MSDANNVPNRKVVAGGVAGAVMIVVAWCCKAFTNVELPADVALSASTLIVFVIQYFVPNAQA